ncbi:MAG: polyprenyl synthetase family protein [Chitinophagaceae bacterium]|jgi:geranylgeranyl diphosphate synthase type II|nr:polyprenyl synthetase family protein [Chitinophagaceae bacterium]
MNSFQDISERFKEKFKERHFPLEPQGLYEPANYFLQLGGKHIRPVVCLMGNELFDEIHPDSWDVAMALEIFHNFTLVHDDIMDEASLRRGKETVHKRFGLNKALLSGDMMMIVAYQYLNKISPEILPSILSLFCKTAIEVCEGQQLDMDFEEKEKVSLAEYIRMIELKTSVLLAASLQMGAMLGGATPHNYHKLYAFGKNLGIAFQIQDDYLDAFGDSNKFGKETGGDIKRNKKTFLLLHALEEAKGKDKETLEKLLKSNDEDKVERVIAIFKNCGVDTWANNLKEKYFSTAMRLLEEVVVISSRKKPLKDFANYLMQRES